MTFPADANRPHKESVPYSSLTTLFQTSVKRDKHTSALPISKLTNLTEKNTSHHKQNTRHISLKVFHFSVLFFYHIQTIFKTDSLRVTYYCWPLNFPAVCPFDPPKLLRDNSLPFSCTVRHTRPVFPNRPITQPADPTYRPKKTPLTFGTCRNRRTNLQVRNMKLVVSAQVVLLARKVVHDFPRLLAGLLARSGYQPVFCHRIGLFFITHCY